MPRPCVCVLCRHRAGALTSYPRLARRPIAKRRAGFSEPPTPDLHRKRSPLIHHIQRVIALTDIPRAIRNNEIGLAKAELCPPPETDLQSARRYRTGAISPALFENPDSTWKLSTCSQIGSAAKLFSVKLRRLAGVSEAGARCRNPERSERIS